MTETSSLRRFWLYYTIALKPTGHESTIHSPDTNIHSLLCPFPVFTSPNLDAIICSPAPYSPDCRLTLPRQEAGVTRFCGKGFQAPLKRLDLPRSPIVRPGATDCQDRNAVEDVVVTMEAMHGCKRMRHGRQDERTSLRRKSLQRGYICDAWQLLRFRGPGVARATWGMDSVQGLYHSNVRVPWRLDIWEPHGGEGHG